MEKRCISTFAAPPFYRHSRKLAASQLKHSSVPVAMLAKPTKYGLSFPFHTALLFPFRDFQPLFIYILMHFVVAFTFAGTGQNNKTIFYIPHTTTIILCDNLHFPFFVAPHIAIAQKNERSMRMKKSAVFNLPPYGIAQKSEGNIRMKKSAAFRLFHEHSDNCEALSELRSSEFARAIVNMRRSEKRNATFFSPYFFRFFLSTHHMRAVKKKCNVFQPILLSFF